MASSAADGKWRVVGKSKKSGDRRKALGENNALAAALATGVPVKTSLYEMGFERIMKKQNKEQVPPQHSAGDSATQPSKKPQQSTGKKPSGSNVAPSPKKFYTVEEAIRALDLAEFHREMEKSQNMFPENPQIWVKDLAGYLNEKLQTPKNEPAPTHQSHDYPYCLANKELKSIIRSVLHKAPGTLELFVDYCILLMQQELDKPAGESVHGYRICIQAVLLDKPKIVTVNLKKYLDMLRSHQSRTAKSIGLMWAIGQAGYHDLAEGLKIWLGMMMPVLGIKTLSPYAISYLERLLRMHSNLTKGFGMIGPKDFFPLLDFAFMPNNSLPASQQEQLRDLYPRLKVLAFGATPESTLHTYFPSFLSRATPNCPAAMKKELLHSLYECLNLDQLSFSVWRQLYTKHLSQSSLLLQHLIQSWETTSKPMRKSVQETAQSFCVTNKDCSSKSSNYKDMEVCESACQTLLQKMKGRRIPTFRIFLIAVVFVSGYIIHDIRSHGSFQDSSSAKMLQQTGIMHVSQEAWSKAWYCAQHGQSWLERNVPAYYSQAVDVLGPGLELLWEKTRDGLLYITQKCSTQTAYLKENLPRFMDWLHSQIPDSVFHVMDYLRDLLLHLYRTYLLPGVEYSEAAVQKSWQQYVDSCNGKVTWDCTKDHLAAVAVSSWTLLQNTTLAIKDWAVAMLSSH